MVRQPLQDVSPRQQLSFFAIEHNAMIAAAKAHQADNDRITGLLAERKHVPGILVSVQNKAVANTDAYTVVKLSDVAIDPNIAGAADFTEPVIEVVDYAAGDPWGIMQVPLAKLDDIEDDACAIGGACWALVDILDVADTTAGPVVGSVNLESGGSGVDILWKPAGTGVNICFVRFQSGGEVSCASMLAKFPEQATTEVGHLALYFDNITNPGNPSCYSVPNRACPTPAAGGGAAEPPEQLTIVTQNVIPPLSANAQSIQWLNINGLHYFTDVTKPPGNVARYFTHTPGTDTIVWDPDSGTGPNSIFNIETDDIVFASFYA